MRTAVFFSRPVISPAPRLAFARQRRLNSWLRWKPLGPTARPKLCRCPVGSGETAPPCAATGRLITPLRDELQARALRPENLSDFATRIGPGMKAEKLRRCRKQPEPRRIHPIHPSESTPRTKVICTSRIPGVDPVLVKKIDAQGVKAAGQPPGPGTGVSDPASTPRPVGHKPPPPALALEPARPLPGRARPPNYQN